MKQILRKLIVAGCLSVPLSAIAADFSFTGTFSNDEEVQLFQFSLSSPATVTLRTYSYGGGTMADGTVIPAGGFDPILSVFDISGLEIDDNDDGDCPPLTEDPVSGSCYDTFLSVSLEAGDYTVSISQYSNFAIGPNLSDGFEGSGTLNFEDAGGYLRTNAWAFDVLNVDSASEGQALNRTETVPVPTMGVWAQALLAAMLALIGFRASRSRRTT